MSAAILAQPSAVGPNAAATYLLFIVAGVLVGGTYSVYKAGSRRGTLVMGVLAVIALAGAILWLTGALG